MTKSNAMSNKTPSKVVTSPPPSKSNSNIPAASPGIKSGSTNKAKRIDMNAQQSTNMNLRGKFEISSWN